MKRLKPTISEQSASDITKINDLIEVSGSKTEKAIWRVNGITYTYIKGEHFVTMETMNTKEKLFISEPNKTAAKRKVFEMTRL